MCTVYTKYAVPAVSVIPYISLRFHSQLNSGRGPKRKDDTIPILLFLLKTSHRMFYNCRSWIICSIIGNISEWSVAVSNYWIAFRHSISLRHHPERPEMFVALDYRKHHSDCVYCGIFRCANRFCVQWRNGGIRFF